jgi:hypothetical protein
MDVLLLTVCRLETLPNVVGEVILLVVFEPFSGIDGNVIDDKPRFMYVFM